MEKVPVLIADDNEVSLKDRCDMDVTVVTEITKLRRSTPSVLAQYRRRVRGGRKAQREDFALLIAYARELHKHTPEALPGLAKMLGRAVQARAMTRLLWNKEAGIPKDCQPDTVLFDPFLPLTRGGWSLDNLKREVTTASPLSLTTDVMLPWPWEKGRLSRALVNLGPGGAWGEWRQDWNHSIELWLPLGIGWVHGGNHTITAGIVHGTGRVRAEVIYDIGPVYRHVTCDGVEFRRKHDGSLIGPVTDLEMAGLFEVGRLLAKAGRRGTASVGGRRR